MPPYGSPDNDFPRLLTPGARACRSAWRVLSLPLIVVAATFGVAALVPLGMLILRALDDGELARTEARLAAVDASRSGTPTATAPSLPPAVLFRGVHVVDVVAGALRRSQDVLVQNGRIAAIRSGLNAPAGAHVVEGAGRFLMPGLVDTHVHVTADDQLLLFVASGVTTVQGLGGPLARNLDARERALRDEIVSPDFVSCDYVVRGGSARETAPAAVERAIAAGGECIKIYSPPDWTQDEHAALVTEALRRGLRIGGHLPRNLNLAAALGHGQQFVAHAEEFLYAFFNKLPDSRSPEHIPAAVDLTRRSGAVIVPTLVAYGSIVRQVGPGIDRLLARPDLRYVPRAIRDEWIPDRNRYRRRFTPDDGIALGKAYEYQKQLVSAWHAAGVPLALGTDASPQMPFVVPGFSALDELAELRSAGLSEADVLRAATVGGARLLNRAFEIGQVTVGYRADLILLDADPLQDVGHVRRRAGVMTRGRWMTEEWLQQQIEGLAREAGGR